MKLMVDKVIIIQIKLTRKTKKKNIKLIRLCLKNNNVLALKT